jgi:hypothetical protein
LISTSKVSVCNAFVVAVLPLLARGQVTLKILYSLEGNAS